LLAIRGYAGKKITPNNAPARYLFGGVVIAQPRVPGKADSYGKAISFGRYYKRSDLGLRVGASLTGNSRGVRMGDIRTKGNPYIKNARDQTRSAVVKMWNKEIGRWIERNGFETTGFGGA